MRTAMCPTTAHVFMWGSVTMIAIIVVEDCVSALILG
jgi:hypothetical protein